MTTVTITTVTDPIDSTTQTAVTASGTTDVSTNTVAVSIVDNAGTTVGPVTATVTGTAWSIAATDISTLADGTVVFEATATDLSAVQAFAAKAADKSTSTVPYITLTEFRAYIHDGSVLDIGPATAAILSATRAVNAICGRPFTQQTVATQQFFWPYSTDCCPVDDIATTDGLLVDVDIAGDGTYSQPWTLNTDFYLDPINRIYNGIPNWPYVELRATFSTKWFPLKRIYTYMRPTVRVTAKWGWPVVPDEVKQATFIGAALLYKLGDAPFGNAGFGEFGVLRVKENPIVNQLLMPYMVTGGIAVA